MKISNFPSYHHIHDISTGPFPFVHGFRALMITNLHNNKTTLTLLITEQSGVERTVRISVLEEQTMIFPFHVEKISITLAPSTGTLGTDVFVYGMI